MSIDKDSLIKNIESNLYEVENILQTRSINLLFKEKNIRLLVGISGSIDETVDKLVKGVLKGGESFCNPGKGKGYGIDKTACDSDKEVCDH